ncbi:NAD(P)H-hydrate epimerase [Fructobacillus fructosus]|uniref:NAD(P)H-hydrate epimerase n=1 Tax=Fructobacillus fructosus TaxID=1631 RepID=A0ABM9MQ30_9LACO|nr:NAD(P)H-hydrate epimerase [Fructobacillus fructosus]MBD9365361.1 NAD(P)H-hydrate epimerase [Leuconostoc mesenteroides]MBC9118697.1 NAD(P)H-hydrate epimerase [Fructobacillus fructosus]CAK1232122.1 NAD(P)H-hydrate epimerase domain (Nnr1) [Fructobacillus fructosus]CAK1239990.1 NAD(P)H-hydrate epimerase domain (Nnr1) [Fructobacillus fructosus]CAK1240848.1 NAD(P)H-hydrate epimerase domain (Nnr1) [Fructobacillus fructosus]
MTQLVTGEEMKAIETYTIDEAGLPAAVLTEQAAMAALQVLAAGRFDLSKVLVLAGLGQNGADGVALARLLHQAKIPVTLQFVGNVNRASQSVKEQLKAAEACGVTRAEKSDFKEPSLIIDAIFGTGLNADLPEGLQKMLKAANHIENTVVALDMPTGIDVNTGDSHGAALKAKATIAFGYQKVGTSRSLGKKMAGRVIVQSAGLITPNDFDFSIQ